MRTILVWRLAGAMALAAAAGCSDSDGGAGVGAGDGAHIVVTTNVLGDVVGELVGADATVEVIMPAGSDPHDFAPSAKQAAAIRSADVLVVNGAGLESGLLDVIEGAEEDGVVVITATDAIEGHADHEEAADHADDEAADHAEAEHGDAEHGDEAADHDESADGGSAGTDEHGLDEHLGHEHGSEAHFFTDPLLMREAVAHLAVELAEHVPALATPAFDARVDDYQSELDDLVDDVESAVATLSAERRRLVTNHDVLGHFADRFGFTVVGVIIPGGSTLAEPSAAGLHELAEAIAAAGVPAVFAETSAPSRLADALAAEGSDVEVVELYTESLGPEGSGADTYLGMIRTNVERIVAALAA